MDCEVVELSGNAGSVFVVVVIGRKLVEPDVVVVTFALADTFVADEALISSIPACTPYRNTPGFTTVLLSTAGGDRSTATGSISARLVAPTLTTFGCVCGELGKFRLLPPDTADSEIGVAGSLSEFSSLLRSPHLIDC